MTLAMLVLFTRAGSTAVTGNAVLRVGHASQHAQARPLQHINNDQPDASAQRTQNHKAHTKTPVRGPDGQIRAS
jgi:hypothetical protein